MYMYIHVCLNTLSIKYTFYERLSLPREIRVWLTEHSWHLQWVISLAPLWMGLFHKLSSKMINTIRH